MDMVDCVDTGKRLEIVLEYASFTKEKFDLYCKYQVQIHKDTMEELSEEAFQRFLVESPLESEASDLSIDYGSFHQKYILDGKLIAVAVLDILPKCISSVYFFYDPDYSSLALGKYSALQEIDLTRKLHSVSDDLKWYYMGFYIHSCPKMNYKGQYKPSDLLDPITYDWYPFTQCQEQLEKTRYAVFSGPIPPPSDTPSGWLDPESIKEDHLKSVRMLAARGQLVPVTAHARWSKSANLRQSVREFSSLALMLFITSYPAELVARRDTSLDALVNYGLNPPRTIQPPYCVGFNITYPSAKGLSFKRGELQKITWEVDRSLPDVPNLVTRIRIFDSDERNEQVLGENITVFTHPKGGATTHFIDVNDKESNYHYRVMVNYPGNSVHCVYQSVPFKVIPFPNIRYISGGLSPPSYAIAQHQRQNN
ncbi:arginine-tRNA-protein transferase [Spinellus fusiger]|nr:arginine-tRNA-protein transferase [Spinellus fusiger]